jgi:type IV pilus assembly protein PilB
VDKGIKKKALIGEELVKAGLITAKQLKFVLEEQGKVKGKDKERLGEIIVRCGFVKEELMTLFLEKYLKIPYINLKEKEHIDPQMLRLIPERMARNFKLIGIEIAGDKIRVAMANPFDVIAMDTIKGKTGYKIERCFSKPNEIEEAIDKFYKESSFEKSIHEFFSLKAEEEEKEKETKAIRPTMDYKKLEIEAGKAPVIEFVNQLLETAVVQGASDIHIEPREKQISIRYRIDGILHETVPPPKAMESSILTRIKLLGRMDIAERRLPQDGRFNFVSKDKNIDIRLASTPTIFGEKLVLRLLDKNSLILSMEDLGLADDEVKKVKHALAQPYGMILVTGPTGSGKTTTLYSALNFINKPEKNIVTIEDPVEYQLEGINQIQIKPLIGLTFASSLRTILRQDPDIIMIGEIRDLETLENAVKASLTGHLVISTIHTNDAPSVVFRLIHMGLEPYLIVACLSMVAAQRLIRKICTNCKQKVKLSESAVKGLEKRLGVDLKNISFHEGKGCKACNGSGYKGRIGIFEVFVLDEEIKRLVLGGISENELKKEALKHGMKTLLQSGLEKVDKGITTVEEVLKVTFIEKAV